MHPGSEEQLLSQPFELKPAQPHTVAHATSRNVMLHAGSALPPSPGPQRSGVPMRRSQPPGRVCAPKSVSGSLLYTIAGPEGSADGSSAEASSQAGNIERAVVPPPAGPGNGEVRLLQRRRRARWRPRTRARACAHACTNLLSAVSRSSGTDGAFLCLVCDHA